MLNSSIRLQQTLEAEYPLLDSSLLAALISELPQTVNDSDVAIKDLHETLSQLSMIAEVQQADHDSQAVNQINGVDVVTSSSTPFDSEDIRESEERSSPDDPSFSYSGRGSSRSSVMSSTSATSLSVLEFLKLLFPKLSEKLIQQALEESSNIPPGSPTLHDVSSEETDVSTIIDHLLNLEFIQDITERGFEEPETDHELNVFKVVTSKGKQSPKRIRPPKHTISLVDVRQRQHVVRPVSQSPRLFSGDPWTRLTSLATRLSDLLPPASPNYFMSFFHAPQSVGPNARTGWKAEGDSLRNALADLINRHPSRLDEAELKSRITTLCDIVLHPESDDIITLDPEQRSNLEADVRLCLTVTKCESDIALDLIWLLRELDQAFEDGSGIAHSVPLSVSPDRASPSALSMNNQTSSAWNSNWRPPIAHPPSAAPPPSSRKHPPATSTWTIVKPRRPGNSKLPHPHADFIPGYANPRKKGTANAITSRSIDTAGRDASWYRHQVGYLQLQREEALREAMRHWHSGNTKTRGGEVALIYAEKARELQEEQRDWALKAARVMVETKRMNHSERNTLDLHGLTVSEACVIVKEAIQMTPPSTANPLKIITGLGRHSIRQIGVLGPAVRDMLQADGYNVSKFDGGLVVRGQR